MQIFLCNVCIVIIGFPLLSLGIGEWTSYLGYGLFPLIFVFIWKKVAESPDEPTRFCCFPCLIPMKYIPLCFFAILALFGSPLVPLAIYALLGYYQFMERKKSLLRLPLKVYRKFDSLMPNSLKENLGYIKVRDVERDLRNVCL